MRCHTVPSRVAVLWLYGLVEDIRFDLLCDSQTNRILNPPDVDSQEDIGRAVCAFGLDALFQA